MAHASRAGKLAGPGLVRQRGDAGDERCHLLFVERSEAEGRRHSLEDAFRHRARRRHQQCPAPGEAGGEPGQHLAGFGIGPMQVVKQDRDRSLVRHRGEQLGQGDAPMPEHFVALRRLGCRRVSRGQRGVEGDQGGCRAGGEAGGAGQRRERGGEIGGEGVGDAALAGVRPGVHGAGARGAQAGVHVLQQAGLAEARGRGDVDVACRAALRLVPRGEDRGELLFAAHQLRHERAPGAGRSVLRRLAGAAERRAGGGLRFPLFDLEQPFQRVCFHCRRGPVVPRLERLEQQPPAALVERVGVARAARHALGLAHPAGRKLAAGERLGGAEEGGPEAHPLQVRPLFELGAARRGEGGEEVAGIERHRALDVSRLHCGEEGVAVGLDVSLQRQAAAPGHEHLLSQGVADLPHRLAHGVERAVGFAVGPEQADEIVAARGAAGGEGEVGDEGERLAGSEQNSRRSAGRRPRQTRPAQRGERQAGVRGDRKRLSVRHLTGF